MFNDDLKKAKLKNFINDKMTSDFVFEFIKNFFLKPRTEKDVHFLAAKSIANDLLSESFNELKTFVSTGPEEPKITKQVGM